MKIRRSLQLLSCVVAMVLALLCSKAIATSCDDTCSAETPTGECICLCCGKDMAVLASDVPPIESVVQYATPFETSHQSLLLATDIFRPPIV